MKLYIILLISLISMPIYTPIHELGHVVVIVLYSIKHHYKLSGINVKLKFQSLLKAKTHCNYHFFNHYEIRIIAISGDGFAILYSVFIALLAFFSLGDSQPFISKIIFSTALPLSYLLFALASWIPKSKPYNDKYIFQYPKDFLDWYTYPN